MPTSATHPSSACSRHLQIWKAWDGKRWDDQPALRCTAHTEAALEVARTPPPALLLECSKTLGLDSTAACLGWYRLTPDPRPKEERGSGSGGASSAGPATSSDTETSEGSSSSGNSNGDVARPFWVHTVHEDRWIGFADASWWCQGKANLGDAKGWLHLPCVSCFTPPGSRQVSLLRRCLAGICVGPVASLAFGAHHSLRPCPSQAWRVWDGKAWTAQPLVRCHARTAAELAAALTPPLALLIEGGRRLHPGASACLGWYNLVSENPGDGSSSVARRINRRPIWKHATHPDRYIAFDGVAWLAQEKVNLGRADGWLELFDAGCISPDLSAQVRPHGVSTKASPSAHTKHAVLNLTTASLGVLTRSMLRACYAARYIRATARCFAPQCPPDTLTCTFTIGVER